jgi:TRAP-type C4-dicarboxylate transport system substrate-binding protein
MRSTFLPRSRAAAAAVGLACSVTAAVAQTKWDMTIPWNPSEFHAIKDVQFAERVKAATNGQLVITVHPSSSLGIKGPDTIRAISDGTVPMGETIMGWMAGMEPSLGMETLPLLVRNQADLRVMHDIFRPDFVKAIERNNQKVIFISPWPPNQFFTNKEIRTLDDLKGLKMRTVDKNNAEFVKQLGMVPVTIGITDVVPALASGALDATMTSLSTAAAYKYWELEKYIWLTNHFWALNAVTVNMDAWKKLTPQQQAAVEKVAHDMEPGFWDLAAAEDAKQTEVFKSKGTIIGEPPPAVLQAMRDVARPIWRNFAKQVGGTVPAKLDEYLKKTGRDGL